MKLSCVCLLVLFACMAKGSEFKQVYQVNTELDKVIDDSLKSLVSIAKYGMVLPAAVADEIQSAIADRVNIEELYVKLNKIYKDHSTQGFRETQNQAIDYAYNTFIKLNEELTKFIQKTMNKSFDSLPKDIQKQVLKRGREINDKLKNIKIEMDKIFEESGENESSDKKNE